MTEPMLVHLEEIDDNPYQTRTAYDEILLISLASNIKEIGLLQIPVARSVGDRYQLAFGHRRKRAFEMLHREGSEGFDRMPLIVREFTEPEMFEISITENIKRQELGPLEKAAALKRYMEEFKATSVQAARLFGIPAGTVRGTIRLLNLSDEAKQEMRAGRLSQTRARVLLQRSVKTTRQPAEFDDETLDLWQRLSILIYGRIRDDVSNKALFNKVKQVFEEHKQLRKQVEIMNSRRAQASRLRGVSHDT